MKRIYNTTLVYFISIQLFIIALIIINTFSQAPSLGVEIPFLQIKSDWVDSLMRNMSREQKIGQLLILDVNQHKPGHKDSLIAWIDKYKIGGIMLNNSLFDQQLDLTATLQAKSLIPLLIGQSQHTEDDFLIDTSAMLSTLSIRNNDECLDFPNKLSIGAVNNDTLIDTYYQMIAEHKIESAINIDFSASLNVDVQTENGCNYDAFGDDIEANIKKSMRLFLAMNKRKIISCINNFKDYHEIIENDQTLSQQDIDEQNNIESYLMPYRTFVKHGVPVIMIDKDIDFVKPDNELSDNLLGKYLNKQLKFKGLIISEIFSTGINLQTKISKTIRLGSDILVLNENIQEKYNTIKNLFRDKIISDEELDTRVKKILMLKAWAGLDTMQLLSNHPTLKPQTEDTINAIEQKSNSKYISQYKKQYTIRQLFEASVTLIKNEHDLLPFNRLDKRKFILQCIGNNDVSELYKFLRFYAPIAKNETMNVYVNDTLKELNVKKLRKFNPVIIAFNKIQPDKNRDTAFFKSLKELDKRTNIVILNFGNPAILNYFDNIETIVQLYDNHIVAQEMAAQMMFGAIQAKGKLPIKVSDKYPKMYGLTNPLANRYKYTMPEEIGISSDSLATIDSIVAEAIKVKATPGCQVFVAKDGKVIYNKSFGYQTYAEKRKVDNFAIYDLASISKIVGTTFATMKLYEKGSINLDDSIKHYLTDTSETSTIMDITIRELLLHQSGLQSNMPIIDYIIYRKNGYGRYGKYFKERKDSACTTQCAKDFYLEDKYVDTIWQEVYNLKVDTFKEYKYSDVNANLLYRILTTKINPKLSFANYLDETFYNSLGLYYVCYQPLKRFSSKNIIPTEKDNFWRKQLLRGYVHDPSAALLGGIAGNAGIFSNANDLAVLFQMLINNGSYGGNKYLGSETINLFTSQQADSYRGLGFDRRSLGSSFGHTGFTGNCVWADKSNNIVFVFLSNRVYPDGGKNKKLYEYEIRERIQQAIYDALFGKTEENIVL